jgi:hypothetical protein
MVKHLSITLKLKEKTKGEVLAGKGKEKNQEAHTIKANKTGHF